MSQTPEAAASPASSAPQGNPGDGKSKPANVSEREAVARFVKMAEQQPEPTSPTADTSATQPNAQASNDSSSAAEPATTGSPETPSTTAPAAPEDTQTTEGQPAAGEEADDVLSPESQTLDQKTKDKIQRRIDKEVGKRKAMEGQIDQLQKQLDSLKTQPQSTAQSVNPLPPPVEAPLPEIKNPADLVKFRNDAKATVRWAEELLDREDIDHGVQIGDRQYSKADIKGFLRRARITLEDQIPAQQDWFQQQAQIDKMRQDVSKQAHADFPFLADEKSPEFKQVQLLRQNHPWLNNLPQADWFAGAITYAFNDLAAKRAKAAATPEKPREQPAAATQQPAKPAPKPRAPNDQAAVTTAGSVQRNQTNGSGFDYKAAIAGGNKSQRATEAILAAAELARIAQRQR